MKLSFFLPATLFLSFIWGASSAPGDELTWLTDLDQARQQAHSENKDLLLNFTGTDWCYWCMRLDEEVFSQPEFAKFADDFVLVQLDFPRDESIVPPETRRQNAAWQQKLGVDAFPTIFLLDIKGRPYAKTGYRDGGVKPYLAHLTELRQVRQAWDDAFAAATASEGEMRARHLDEGLSTIAGELIAAHYRDLVEEIIRLDDDNQFGLKERYQDLLLNADAQRVATEVGLRVYGLVSEQKTQEATELLEQELTKAGDNRVLRHRLQFVALRTGLLPFENPRDAVDVMRELLESPHLEETYKPELQQRLAAALVQAGQTQQAMQQFDEMIAAMDGSEAKARGYLMKAQILAGSGMQEEALAAYARMSDLLETGSDAWIEGQVRIGFTYAMWGRTEEAVDHLSTLLEDEELEVPIRCYIMAAKAQALLMGGDRDAAAETAQAAREALAKATEAGDAELSQREANWRELANRFIEDALRRTGPSD